MPLAICLSQNLPTSSFEEAKNVPGIFSRFPHRSVRHDHLCEILTHRFFEEVEKQRLDGFSNDEDIRYGFVAATKAMMNCSRNNQVVDS
uniref:Uncharacterized protein n=1 Tax=Candidatus Kentrum sp. LFY TaxID=2126342 RepID=A0A450V864_9GAMM|nr:MAG: hypothetical protein BECKLFY1418B_GA0070995_12202 [Candidatus Kentron sp. LFY]